MVPVDVGISNTGRSFDSRSAAGTLNAGSIGKYFSGRIFGRFSAGIGLSGSSLKERSFSARACSICVA
jgi:hypothetical protein